MALSKDAAASIEYILYIHRNGGAADDFVMRHGGALLHFGETFGADADACGDVVAHEPGPDAGSRFRAAGFTSAVATGPVIVYAQAYIRGRGFFSAARFLTLVSRSNGSNSRM